MCILNSDAMEFDFNKLEKYQKKNIFSAKTIFLLKVPYPM